MSRLERLDTFSLRAPSRAMAAAVLLVGIAAVYAGSVSASFQFDDFNVIVDYTGVHSLRAWFDALPGIRPLLKLSYALNWSLDTSPIGFRLFNICCHCINALLVFALGRRLLALAANVDAMALFAALLFALHPAQTEAVTYISGRSVTLMSVFYLAALVTATAERPVLRNGIAPLLFVAALLVKETAWTLPFAVLLLWHLRAVPLRESLHRTRVLWIALLVGAVCIVATPAYRRMLLHVFSIRSPLDNAVLQVDGWWYLLTHPLLLQTNIDPDVSTQPALDLDWWLRLAVLMVGIVAIWRSRSSWLRFALLWFFLHLLPTNSLLPRNDIANDRQLYLALVGPASVIARFIVMLRPHWARASVAVLLPILLGVATLQRNRDYRDEITLWRATAQHSPAKARVWNNLGYAYQMAGYREPAITAYERALSLDASYDRARINWLLLRESGSENAVQ
ncbi:MAG TPA: tetratricopeptide repeat protein [Spongiibacteraceae bacterium]|nr:tetratricopeptide repeat protein [Spongiibacteraceae bacterium]